MDARHTPARGAPRPMCTSYSLCGWTWMPVSGSHTLTWARRLQPCNDLSSPPAPRLRFSSALETVCTSIGHLLGL
jgi:predicted dienelactone hydrolase